MEEKFENIRKNTTCSECGGKEMAFGYPFEGTGAVKKKGSLLGLDAFSGVGNMIMIVCQGCGFVAKSFVIAR
jgi:rubredoxin